MTNVSYKDYRKRISLENKAFIRTLLFKHAVVILIIEIAAYLFLSFAMSGSVGTTIAMGYMGMIGAVTVGCWILLVLAYLWEKWEDDS